MVSVNMKNKFDNIIKDLSNPELDKKDDEMEYKTKEKTKLEKSFAIFIDILGFTEEIKSTNSNGTSQNHLDKLKKALDDSTNFFKRSTKYDLFQMKSFSDNIYISASLKNTSDEGEASFGSLILDLQYYQFIMIKHGFFIRGGWDIGDSYIGDNIVYGMGLINSYELESSSEFPMIALSKKVLKKVKKHCRFYGSISDTPHANSLIYDNTKKKLFINYLEIIIEENSPNQYLLEHKNTIEKKLKKYKKYKKIYSKYHWAANYHNFFINNFTSLGKDFTINIKETYKFTTFSDSYKKI